MTRTNPVQTGPVQTVGLPAAAFHHWIHSQEEDAAGVDVYRPEGFTFPPSRGRTGFQLNPDGGFMEDEIEPGDGGVQVSGRWTLRGPGQVAVSFPGTSRPGYLLQVMAVDDSVLRCRRDSVDLPDKPPQDEGSGWTAYIDRQPPG